MIRLTRFVQGLECSSVVPVYNPNGWAAYGPTVDNGRRQYPTEVRAWLHVLAECWRWARG